jgi:LPS O-antigen subunit length determinant protein (WzzB/FepE family)
VALVKGSNRQLWRSVFIIIIIIIMVMLLPVYIFLATRKSTVLSAKSQ